MLQFATPVTVVSPAGPRQFVRSAPPFVFAFAMGGAPTRPERIVPGEITVIEIADGACRSSRQDDWFAARVPAIPAAAGPLRVCGAAPGDTLELEVLALEP
ncbi:MAG: Acetamidase/Formamidase family, partial [Thermomicrobiales bacterium]|nr:Acetamidase/Formamidase family [Thermomicrobiales bacterium]